VATASVASRNCGHSMSGVNEAAPSGGLSQALPYLQCIHCRSVVALQLSGDLDRLHCSNCHTEYEIVDGIPILLHGATNSSYDIPWHPVNPTVTHTKRLASYAKDAVTSVPFLRTIVYKILYGPNKLYLTDEVSRQLASQATVADVGCRNIPYVSKLSRIQIYFAIDIDLASLRYIKARNHPNVVPILASIEDLPLRSDSCDRVICLEVLEHVQDDVSAFKELARITKPAGSLLLTTPDGDTVAVHELPPPRLHLRHYRKTEIRSHLEQSWGSVAITSMASWFPFWRLADRVEDRKRRARHWSTKLLTAVAFYPANFLSNIVHAVCERTAYRSKAHCRIVAKCTVRRVRAGVGSASSTGWTNRDAAGR